MKKRNASMCFHMQKAEFEKTPILAPPSTGIVIEYRTESHRTKSHRQKVTDEKSQLQFCILTKHIGQKSHRTKSHNIKFGIGQKVTT